VVFKIGYPHMLQHKEALRKWNPKYVMIDEGYFKY